MTNNHLNMFVVNLYALQTVNILNFSDQIVSQILHALQSKDVMRTRFTVSNYLPLCDLLTLKNI